MYKYYNNGNEVICVAKFDGKNIKTKAKCHPDDKFDVEYGKELAMRRMDEKMLKLKLKDVHSEIEGIAFMLDYFRELLDKRLATEIRLKDEYVLAKVRKEALEEI